MSTTTSIVTTPANTTIRLTNASESEGLTMVRTIARDALNNSESNPQIPRDLLVDDNSSGIDTGLVQFLNSDSVSANLRTDILEAVADPSIDGTGVFNTIFNSVTPEMASAINDFLLGVGNQTAISVFAPINGILTLGFAMGYGRSDELLNNLTAALPRPNSNLTEAITRNEEITETRITESNVNTSNTIRRLEEINEERIAAMNRFSLNLFNLSMRRFATGAAAILGGGAVLYLSPRIFRTAGATLGSLGLFGSIANTGSDAVPSLFGGSPSNNPNNAPSNFFSLRAFGKFLINTGKYIVKHNDDDK